ncbi:DNA-binding protein [Algoriphagus boritolerans]|uniref:DNA-binding protein n=1 Tax=Algoriphagus boritolerans TaxID=308111 RepID=UPI000ACD0595
MEFIKQIERLQLLNKLVKEKRTGSPEELAKRLSVSRAKLYLILEELRDRNVYIKFNKRINSFEYEACRGINLEFSFRILRQDEEKLINGGKILNFFLRVHYFRRSETKLAL